MSQPDGGPALTGVPFVKMTGSGNDFVFFDGRVVERSAVTRPEVIQAICNRHNGIGADGVVVLEPLSDASVAVHYFNSDGSPADLCGNASLCSTALSAQLGLAEPTGMTLLTGAGAVESRLPEDGDPRPLIRLQPVRAVQASMPIDLAPGERQVGFAVAGIPHLVVLCDDVDTVPLEGRGPVLRRHPSLGAAGANVNWVARRPDGRWAYRTFERGVEGETLACGTGAVATGCLLVTWGLAASPVTIRSRSGRDLTVGLQAGGPGDDGLIPTLRGEGRVVFQGQIGNL